MNLTILRWLLQNRDVLTKVIQAASKFDRSAPMLVQWEVVDEIARLVIPALESVQSLAIEDEYSPENAEAEAFALGAMAASLGVDWKQLVEVILPILIAILQALKG